MVQGVVVEDGHLIDVNPATGEAIARVRCSTVEDIKEAVKRAREAQPAWHATPLAQRIAVLKAACTSIDQDAEELAQLITKEMGKIIKDARAEVYRASHKDSFLDLIMEANAPQQISGTGGTSATIVRDPFGVVALLSPWNFPVGEIVLLVLPALAAGNTVVLKPSEVTPLTGAKLFEILSSHLPPGVLNLIQGDGAAGAALVESDIDMVAMTGSCETGKKIMAAAAPDLKRVVLELGGKDPMVVFGDADLEKAAEHAVDYSLENSGQVCCSVERIYVEQAVKAKFEELCVEKAKRYVVGNGANEDITMGPMASQVQKSIVEQHVSQAVQAGARLLYKGETPDGPNYYPVTVITDVNHDMKLAIDETFGPVVTIIGFDGSESEAVRLSNATQYGLGASVYSEDKEKAARVAALIHAGQVGINSNPAAPAACPWVGAKMSGYGSHSGIEGWRMFSSPKSIVIP